MRVHKALLLTMAIEHGIHLTGVFCFGCGACGVASRGAYGLAVCEWSSRSVRGVVGCGMEKVIMHTALLLAMGGGQEK